LKKMKFKNYRIIFKNFSLHFPFCLFFCFYLKKKQKKKNQFFDLKNLRLFGVLKKRQSKINWGPQIIMKIRFLNQSNEIDDIKFDYLQIKIAKKNSLFFNWNAAKKPAKKIWILEMAPKSFSLMRYFRYFVAIYYFHIGNFWNQFLSNCHWICNAIWFRIFESCPFEPSNNISKSSRFRNEYSFF